MSKYDKEREAMGLKPVASSASSGSSGQSKYAAERDYYQNPGKYNDIGNSYMDESRMVNESRTLTPTSNSSFGFKMQGGVLPNMDIRQSPLMKQVQASQVPQITAADPSRQLPVIGPVFRTLDAIGHNPITEKIAEIARMFYVPGAGVANVAGLAGSAESAVARSLPSLGNTAAGRIAQKGLSEGIVGAPLAAGQTAMTNPDASLEEFLKQAALGAALGGGIGVVGKGIQAANSAARMGLTQADQKASFGTAIQDFMNRTKETGDIPYDAAAQARSVRPAPGGFVNPAQQAADRFGFIDQRTNPDTLALPPSNREVQMNQAQQRGTNPSGSEPIAGQGDVYTYGLPEPNVGPPTKARIVRQQAAMPNEQQSRPLPPMMDNYHKPLSTYTDRLYRETSGDSALELIPGSNVITDTKIPVYLANNKELALGQGKNKGVLIEFDSGGIQGQVNTAKPTWKMVYDNGGAEFIGNHNSQTTYQNAVRSVTIKPGAQMDKVIKSRLKRVLSNWEKESNPDGSTTFFVPGKEPVRSRSITPESIKKAREIQQSGASGPVKSTADRYNGGVIADAAAPREQLQGVRQQQQPQVEVIPPKRKFAPSADPSMPISPAPEVRAAGSGPVRKASRKVKPKSDPVMEQNFNTADTQAGDATQNYAGNVIPFRQGATQSERTINRNKVVSNIKKNLGVVIDTGKLKRTNRNGNIAPANKGTLGQYKISPEVVRTRMAEDLQVISHEVGHHLDKKHALQDTKFMGEYYTILRNNPVLNVAAYHPSQLPSEAVAEYVRLRLTDPAAARRLAPKYSEYFDSKLPPKVLKGLEASQNDINTWITQGDYNQAKGLIDFESGNKKEPFNKDKTYTRFVDDLNPLKLAEKALKGAVGIGKDSIYKMARLSRGIAERAKLAVTRGIYDAQGKKVVDGLREIMKPLEKLGIKEEDFATYLAVKHAVDLKRLGKQVPFDDAQIKAVLGRLDTPEVQAVQKQVIKYNNALLDVLVEAGRFTRQQVQEMQKKYPNYASFQRYFEEDALAGFKNGGYGSSKGFANLLDPIKRMSEEGSTRTIINPIESMVKNTFAVMNFAAKNKVGIQLSELAKIDGAGAWVEHIGPGGRDPKDHVIAVWINGEKQSFKIREPELYNAMLSLDTESTNSLIKFLGGSASLLRAGATLTPEFTIRNAMRDVIGATVNSTKYGFNPLDFFKGLFHVIGKTQTFDQFISSGGAMGTMQALDRDASREALKAVFKLSMKDKFMKIVSNERVLANLISEYNPIKPVVGGLRKAAEVSELSTKVGAFNKALKKTGSLEEAAYTAKDLMDFNRAGSSIRQANRAVAFLNASIQGTDRMARAFKDNKAGFLVRAFTTLVLPAAGLHYWIHNLPDDKKKIYDNIPQWQKDSFFIIPGPGDTFFRMPKPFEAGMLFATGTERALRWLADNDPDAYKQYGSSVLEAMTPPVMFSALTPLLEAITNHSFFRDAPIVPQGEQGLEKKDQYGLFTSETSKQAGNLISMIPGLSDSNAASPRIIDNTLKGYTAGLGQYGVQALDTVLNAIMGDSGPPRPAKQWNEKPPVSSFMATTSGGGQVRQDFYDKWDKLTKAKNSADRNQVAFTDPDYGRMKGAYNTITQINKQYKAIQKDRAISAQDKRSKLDALDGKMNDIAAKGLGK